MKINLILTRPENCTHYSVSPGTAVTLDLEREYLPRVVASEIYEKNDRTPMEAKKAQAIAARTYVVAHALAGTVMDDTANYQAYKYMPPESIPNSVQAVRGTAGQVLMYNGKLITAWYSASNGGRTKRSDEAWKEYKPWTVDKDDLFDLHGRAKWGEIKASHGVGMSQIGAAYAAYLGKTCAEILDFYYPGTVVSPGYGAEPQNDKGSDESMNTYTITVDYHTKNDCYKVARVRDKTHVIVHSTAAKGPAYIPRWQQWNTPGFDKCAHAFVDWSGIYQTLPWNYQGWVNGVAKGNDCSIAFEICEPLEKNDTPAMAADLYGKTLYLCAHLCREFGIPPENVICHAEAYKLGLASNHADVNHWWGKKDTAWEPYTMNRLRVDVAEALGIKKVYPYEALVVTDKTPLGIYDAPTGGNRKMEVPKGGIMTVTGPGTAERYQVRKDGMTGYAARQYLRRYEGETMESEVQPAPAPEPEPMPEPAPEHWVVMIDTYQGAPLAIGQAVNAADEYRRAGYGVSVVRAGEVAG